MSWQILPTETLIFIVAILIVAVFFHIRFDKKARESAPTILTTLGIFATFFAIALGLLKFNTANIQQSVPALLESMKTAFWASVFGVGCALTFKGREVFTSDDDKEYDDENFNEMLFKEIQQLRKENNEHLANLLKAQNEAMDKIAKSSSEELVKALQEVIKDFNAKINEQFGENFKQLNQAVEKLVIWQAQYKDYIDISTKSLNDLSTKFDILVKNSTQLTDNISTITQNAQSFNLTAKELQSVLGNLDEQRKAIQLQLTTLSTLVSKASNDLPQINSQILSIAQTMQTSANDFNIKVEGLATKTGEQMLSIAQTMQHSANDFNVKVEGLAIKTGEQTTALTTGIEDALKQSLNTLGGQLTAMTEKFASDYGQLAQALADISKVTRNSGK